MRWRSWVIITPPKRDDPIYAWGTRGFSAAKRLRSTGILTCNVSVTSLIGMFRQLPNTRGNYVVHLANNSRSLSLWIVLRVYPLLNKRSHTMKLHSSGTPTGNEVMHPFGQCGK